MLTFRSKTIALSEIKIPNHFETTHPKTSKIAACYDSYCKHGMFGRAIIVDNSGLLLDGYVAYLIARMMGIEQVKVVQVSGIEQTQTKAVEDKPAYNPEPPNDPARLYNER